MRCYASNSCRYASSISCQLLSGTPFGAPPNLLAIPPPGPAIQSTCSNIFQPSQPLPPFASAATPPSAPANSGGETNQITWWMGEKNQGCPSCRPSSWMRGKMVEDLRWGGHMIGAPRGTAPLLSSPSSMPHFHPLLIAARKPANTLCDSAPIDDDHSATSFLERTSIRG